MTEDHPDADYDDDDALELPEDEYEEDIQVEAYDFPDDEDTEE